MAEPAHPRLDYPDIEAAAERITGRVRTVSVAAARHGRRPEVETATGATWIAPPTTDPEAHGLFFALEFLQHTGTFKARGAQNFIRAHLDEGSFPAAGVTIASGGNAGLACAWAAREAGVRATVFVPETAPLVKVDRLRSYGAEVRQIGAEYAEAAAACAQYAESSGALVSHAYDDPLIAAGAGTVFTEILAQVPDLDTVVVSVGGGGLFAGVATAATFHGVRTVAVEPQGTRAFSAALEAGEPVDVTVDSVAADSLGARRATPLALAAARTELVTSVLVADEEIIAARRHLWAEHRLVVEHAAATALAGIRSRGGYAPDPGEKVAVVLCGANTDLGDL